MKTKDKKELVKKTEKELEALLNEAKEALFNLKLEKAQNKLKNLRSIFLKRKEVAKILTAMQERRAKDAKNI